MLWVLIAFVAFAVRQYARSAAHHRHETHEPPDPVTLLPIYEGLASAPENAPIKLIGKVRAGTAAFTSALGGEPCVACLVGATVWHSKKIPQVVASLRDATAAPFTLVLPDGEVEVTDVTAVDCPTRKVARHPGRELVVLTRHKLERHADSTELTEGRIVDGDRVTGARHPDGALATSSICRDAVTRRVGYTASTGIASSRSRAGRELEAREPMDRWQNRQANQLGGGLVPSAGPAA